MNDNASMWAFVGCRVPHFVSSLLPTLLALACNARLARDTCFLPLAVARPACHTPYPRGLLTVAIPLRTPSCARYLCSPHISLSILRPLTAKRLPSLFPNPNAVEISHRSRPCQWPPGTRARAPRVVLGQDKGLLFGPNK